MEDIPIVKASDFKTPAEILKSARCEKGFSIRELAKKVECSHVHLLKIERGEKRPTARLLDRLQRELGLTPFQIIHKRRVPEGILPTASADFLGEEIIRLPLGSGTVVALLVDALMRGGYKPTLCPPSTNDNDTATVVTIKVDLVADGRIEIPVKVNP
jgi:transcriptional regulator with XRE-family HTH domain